MSEFRLLGNGGKYVRERMEKNGGSIRDAEISINMNLFET